MADVRILSSVTQSVAASALKAQQHRMRLIAENMANANSGARDANGDPYRRQAPMFEPMRVGDGLGVRVSRIVEDQTPFKTEYAPGAPGADASGYLKMPNVDTLVEALDMREAQRAYEANLGVIETSRSMDSRVLDLLKR